MHVECCLLIVLCRFAARCVLCVGWLVVGCWLLLVVFFCLLFVGCNVLIFSECCLLLIDVCCLLFVGWLLLVVGYLSVVACRSLCDVSRLLYVVCCWLVGCLRLLLCVVRCVGVV